MVLVDLLKPQNLVGGIRRIALMPWPGESLGPSPDRCECNRLCWAILLVSLVFPFTLVLWGTFVTGEPVDFVYFYGIGQIVHTHPATMLYDYGLQLKVFNQILPMHQGSYGPSPYPPFVALFFSLAARLPFKAAFLVWMAISLCLYVIGIVALLNAIGPVERLKSLLIAYIALAFYPFLVLTLANGQLASIAFCCVALAISLERKGWRFCSGAALSLLTYKPTLLLLLIPMLLLTRKFKLLMGFLTGVLTLGLVATAAMGVQIWPAYFHLLNVFRHAANSSKYLLRWQLVDLSSFSFAVPGGRSLAGLWLLASAISVLAVWLFAILWKSASDCRPVRHLVWATTITWTLLLNVYVPMYDSVLLLIAIFLTIAALRDLEWIEAKKWTATLAGLIFASSYFSREIARVTRIQVVTILLLALGVGQLFMLRKTSRASVVVAGP